MEWANLIVPSVISIIGFVVTYLSMCKQFKDSIKQQLTEEQRKVYLDTYVDVEKIVTTNEIIFEPHYYDELVSHKAIIRRGIDGVRHREFSGCWGYKGIRSLNQQYFVRSLCTSDL